MGYYSRKHHRRSIRLKGYDSASAGAYFVTINVKNRECLLGEIVAGRMIGNAAAVLVQNAWDGLPERYPLVEQDAFVIMLNHVHGILLLTRRSI